MRLVDAMLRQGHLSERALTDALLTGDRPVHLDRCQVCADRAADLNRWLDEVRLLGLEAVDAVFPADALQAQHAQVMRKLAQLDQPAAKVIAFPSASMPSLGPVAGRRVAAGWVGVAAAAGLVLGLVGGQLTARFGQATPTAPIAPTAAAVQEAEPTRRVPEGLTVDELLRSDFDEIRIPTLDAINASTPRLMANAGG